MKVLSWIDRENEKNKHTVDSCYLDLAYLE